MELAPWPTCDRSRTGCALAVGTAITNTELVTEGVINGCGKGRNYLPLIDSGLRLYGLDVSEEAIDSTRLGLAVRST